MKPKRRTNQLRILEGLALAGIAVQACTGSPLGNQTTAGSNNSTVNPSVVETQVSNAAPGVKVTFHYSNFFSLTAPKDGTNCAGDGRTYFKPLDYSLPHYQFYKTAGDLTAFPQNPTDGSGYVAAVGPSGAVAYPISTTNDPGVTLKPSFIKNIALDLTDANSPVSTNGAYSCSFGANPAVPPPSSCATFDYGAIGGVPTSLGGTFLIIGGIQDGNYAGYSAASLSSGFQGPSVACGPARPTSELTAPDGYSTCPVSMFALGVDTLPASVATTGPSALAPGITGASTPISTWANLGAIPGASGPKGVAGASVAFNTGLQRILLFGGAAPLVTQGPANAGADTTTSWAYDLKAQRWSYLSSSPFATNAMITLLDLDGGGNLHQFNKGIGSRSLFGFIAVPGTAITAMSKDGFTNWDHVPLDAACENTSCDAGKAKIDSTERIFAVGGLTSDGVMMNTQKFNPTFGPEFVDTLGRGASNQPGNQSLVQWMDSYHTQLINDSDPLSFYQPYFNIPGYAGDGNPTPPHFLAYNFGTAPVRNYNGGNFVSGFALTVGGFEATITNTALYPGAMGSTGANGNMYYSGKFRVGADPITDSYAGAFSYVPNHYADHGKVTPTTWTRLLETSSLNNTSVPWYGGVSALPGFSLTDNDVVYFGGSSCREYLSDSTLSSATCDGANPGRYWKLSPGANNYFDTNVSPGKPFPAAIAPTVNTFNWNGTAPPLAAGLASARGEDESGNVIIVAWGGMKAPVVGDVSNQIHVLYNQGNANPAVPKWMHYVPTGEMPVSLTNAAMVFSHVTGKFYVFGGLQASGVTKTVSDTWELTPHGSCQGAGCTFTWRKLNVTGGLTCYPEECPQERRSHRMVEVNYNNYNAFNEPDCTQAARPCSFGIFMQGGTPNGYTLLSDRWMFDPTANGGAGHWQRVDGFPPRHLAAMAPLDYYVQTQTGTVHRAIMFGGETALHSPAMGRSNPKRYFVPPTLADTFMYDFENNSWNRVELLGKGYKTLPLTYASQYDLRQAYDATAGGANVISQMSPPPLSGAMMVSRVFPSGTRNSATPLTPLAIPEVYLIGGRLKTGKYNTFDRVFKFCTGTTGELPPNPITLTTDFTAAICTAHGGTVVGGVSCVIDNANCDAYDSVTNPDSPGALNSYVGRWLRKVPDTTAVPNNPFIVDPSKVASYLGSATYDPWNDKIVLYGGLTSNDATAHPLVGDSSVSAAVTDPPASRGTLTEIYEYTPASKVAGNPYERNGYWAHIPNCPGSPVPTGRYGHNLGYDQLNNQLVLVGGYDINGGSLTRNWKNTDGTDYTDANGDVVTTPEVWTAKRIENSVSDWCYQWTRKTTFGNSPEILSQAPPVKGLAHAAGIYIPASGYNTGYYSLFDNQCAKAGAIATNDPEVNKLLAGGVYIDIDRSALGPSENLLLNLTYIPLGTTNQRPDGVKFGPTESAIFKVHLVKTGQSVDTLRSVYQPRHLAYAATDQFPEVVQTLSVLAPPTGSLRQDQILIPISVDPAIDRIRIERYSGSAILIDASVFRMGYR